MSEPTDADYKVAGKALGWHETWPVEDLRKVVDVFHVAAALAAEREKARAPFLALADELATEASRLAQSTEPEHGLAYASISERIRRAASE